MHDVGLLDSAGHRPGAVLYGAEAHLDLNQKAAALLDSLVGNHALIDGNKRLGWLAVIVFYGLNGVALDAPDDPACELVMSVARGEPSIEESHPPWPRGGRSVRLERVIWRRRRLARDPGLGLVSRIVRQPRGPVEFGLRHCPYDDVVDVGWFSGQWSVSAILLRSRSSAPTFYEIPLSCEPCSSPPGAEPAPWRDIERPHVSTSTLTRPETKTETAGIASGGAHRRSPLLRPYVGYVGYFVGAGLISGGIVHYPLDPGFYARIAIAGVAVFLAASVLNEIVLSQTRLAPTGVLRVLGASLLLSIGIGMLSGGIQHFTDFPTRAATLVPVGMVVSFSAYVLRHGFHGQGRRLIAIAALVLAASATAFVGLQALAADLAAAGTGEHGHDATPSDSQSSESSVEHSDEQSTTDPAESHVDVESGTEDAGESAPASGSESESNADSHGHDSH